MQGTFWERDNGFISLASALSSQLEEGSGRLLRHGIVPICRHGAITFTSLQGAFLLATSFREPALLERKLQRLEKWIRSL